ncbi:MAG: sigma 54-interacting transcriptional regulator [Pirellulaceae bacterium]|nr:sigma 54-interacting transcriptional regulator [Pirellulaceae bacterium]MDP7019751.1 sigma 54-interacting transcriptional regulator [Pirellulaceae bacterium]
MTTGSRSGTHFSLQDGIENRIGRGVDCNIVLTDPLSSRVHAIAWSDEDGWWVRDAESRNGTFVNDQKADEVRLTPGSILRIGSTEFRFQQTVLPPPDSTFHETQFTQTIVRDTRVSSESDGEDGVGLTALMRSPAALQQLLLLYQLSIRLLECDQPDEVLAIGLDLVRDQTKASVAGFLWVSDDGQLKPKLVIPEDDADKVVLSESLTTIVCTEGRAVWIDNQTAVDDAQSLDHYADALCVPLVRDSVTIGAIHLYLEHGRFSQSEFDFALSLGSILSSALARARQQARLVADHQRLVDKSAGFDELIGESKPMETLKGRIKKVARATGCVLIRGESGAGKELVARAVHKHSTRADRPMLSVNCAAIPRDLMESQLFGHRKGAFTGAEGDHVGWFEQADSGTLFLDEVGEMTLEGQAKLLRILEGHPFLPVGGNKEITVDVRVIAATNRDLADFVRDGKFREDLYYRLSVFELYIPPLRERGSDIERLVHHFLDHFRMQHGRPDLDYSEQAKQKLISYNWPGNVRQLRNVIDSAVVMAEGDRIESDDLGLRDVGGGELESLRMDFWERKLIREALSRTDNHVPEAAKLLGIGRATLYRKIDEYDIER